MDSHGSAPLETLDSLPSFAYAAKSIAWSPMATAHRGLGSEPVEMTPYGRLWKVYGGLSRVGEVMPRPYGYFKSL